tara:strand:+ start:232 stop:1197 length:966 start_codon:yes stop_codon:yes gene_type:complete
MKSKVYIKKLDSYSLAKTESFIRDVVSRINGKNSLFSAGQKVLLKPNLLRGFIPEQCVTTHPVIVEAMCRVLKDFSVNKITISDSPALGSLEAVASKAGYDPIKKKYGVKITPLTDPVPFENEEGVPHLKISGCIKEFDHIINLPKVKSHCQMVMTLAIKNLFGLVIGKRKPVLHCLVQNDKIKFGKMLIDIARHVNPCFTVADGVHAMQGQGPIHGSPYPLGMLFASQDMTALDRVAAEILMFPKVYSLEAARLKGYGNYDLEKIELPVEANLLKLMATDFKRPRPMDISFNPYRVLKSFIKQFYEVGIKEKGYSFLRNP